MIEAIVSILVVISVLLVLNSERFKQDPENLTELISPILEEISQNSILREEIINNIENVQETIHQDYLQKVLEDRPDLEGYVKICNAEDICSLDRYPEPEPRDGNIYSQTYSIGKPLEDLRITGKSDKRGTFVRFTPDDSIFEDTTFSFDIISLNKFLLLFLE